MTNYKLLPLLCAVFLCVSDARPLQAQQQSTYELVFSDEFNQKNGSQPDPTKWSRHTRNKTTWARWISNSPDVVYIKNGCLVCRAIPNRSEPTDTAKMLTGAINSKGKFEFQYGRVEVRMKTNRKEGSFPAVWMGKNNHLDKYGEIDIVENFGNKVAASHAIHSQLTFTNAKHGLKNIFREEIDVRKWHVYGVEWTDRFVRWMVDGTTVAYFEKSKSIDLLEKGQWTFDYPFYLIMNQSVGNGEYGNFANVNQKYETRFDWIRVYQRKK